MTGTAAKAPGVRARGRAAIAARTLRTDRWWAYPLTTFAVLLAFVGYATYAAVANRDYYAAPYLSPFYSPCLSFHCGTVPGSVTDVSASYGWALRVPSFAPAEGLGPGGYRMQQPDIDRSQEFRKCIECWLCQDICHVIRDHEDNKPAYAGPRYFIRHAELDMHPLDVRDRREVLRERQGLGLCNITKCCTEVCPAGIKITDNAIIPMKERSADQRYDPLGRVLRSWRREGPTTAG